MFASTSVCMPGQAAGALIALLLCVGCGGNDPGGAGPAAPSLPPSQNGDTAAPAPEAPIDYWLLVTALSSSREELSDDESLTLGGGPLGGPVVKYVNDSPVAMQCFGGTVKNITPWLVHGVNTVALKGKHDSLLCLKVLRMPRDALKSGVAGLANVKFDVVARASYEVEQDSCTASFDLAADYDLSKVPPFETLPHDWVSRQKQEKELRAILADFEQSIRAHDAERACGTLFPRTKWSGTFGVTPESVDKMRERALRMFGDPALEFQTKASEVRLVFGKRSALAYTGMVESDTILYSFLFQWGERPGQLGPMVFVRLSGKWVVL